MPATIDTRWISPPLPFQIPVPSPAVVRRLYDQLIVERATSATGVFAEVTTAGTRIPLDDTTTLYEYLDDSAGGLRTNWYRVRFRNSGSAALSAPTDAIQGGDDPALDILTPRELRDVFLFGLNLTAPDGSVISDAVLEWYIKAAVTYAERLLGIYLRETEVEEKLDYVRGDWIQYGFLQLSYRPVIAISEAKMTLPEATGDRDLIVFDPAWLRMDDPESGILQVVPTGTITGPAAVAALVNSALFLRDRIPQVMRVTYTAGFRRGRVPFDMKNLVGLIAAIGPLHLAGNIVTGTGIGQQVTSLDALMHSVKTTADPANEAFGAQIANLKKEIARAAADIRAHFSGPQLTALG